MDFQTASTLGSFLSKDYAEALLVLLATYRDISASEAASRLNLHIQTAQDALETMTSLGILSKVEVSEKKRPYFRYRLAQESIRLEIDLRELREDKPAGTLSQPIREKRNTKARFTTARSGDAISSVAIWKGEGRDRKERRINLTTPQGRFLFYLPFPNAEPMTVRDIMRKADLAEELSPEILDIVSELTKLGVIEKIPPK
jgi:predicted ArsR family transcriptional regulator